MLKKVMKPIPLKTVIKTAPCLLALRACLLFSLITLIGCAGGPGSTPSTPTFSNTSMTPSSSGSTSDPYARKDLLRVGDALIIRLTGVPDAEQGVYETKVDEGGQVSMPHIGAVPAANLTTVQLKEKIETLYKMQRIYTNPNITVTTQQSRYVSVTGEVRAPQRLFHSKDLTALGAIASCGGFTDYANRRKVRILRGTQAIEFNAQAALTNPANDVPMFPDDKIQVDRSVF